MPDDTSVSTNKSGDRVTDSQGRRNNHPSNGWDVWECWKSKYGRLNLDTEHFSGCLLPPAALVRRVDSKNVQFFLVVFLSFRVEKVLPVLVQVVDQVPVETVLGDDVDGAWEGHGR